MKKNILLPTDFSKNAWNAICYAIELYKHDECDFYLLNTFSIRGYTIDAILAPGEKAYDDAKEVSERGLTKIIDGLQFREDSNKHKFIKVSLYGDLLNNIQTLTEEKDIDLIIMGTKGATGSSEVFFGSNTISVMENAKECSVLAIPEKAEFNQPDEIVFPTSFKTHYKRRELKRMVEVSRLCKAPIRILHVSEEAFSLNKTQEHNKELIEEYLEEINYSFHSLSNIEVQTAINCFVESRGSGMIAFVNKPQGLFAGLFVRSLVKKVSYHSKVPILVMPSL